MTIGTPGLGPDDAAHLDPGQLGEHQVEQDEVGPFGAERDERLATVRGGDHPEAVGLERVDERFAQGGLVVDDEDRSCHLPLSIATRVNASFAPTSITGVRSVGAPTGQRPALRLSGSFM